VAVKWEDITSLVRFSMHQDFECKRLYKMSVGFVVKETDEYVVIADDIDLTYSGDSSNNYGTLIPKGCIREWNVIKRYECVDEDTARLQEYAEPLEPVTSPIAMRRLTAFLESNPNLIATPRQLALRLGLREHTVEHQLAMLEQQRLVERIGEQVYCSNGRKALAREAVPCPTPAKKRRRKKIS